MMYDEHFEKQAVFIKRLYYQYKAKVVVIDANGLIKGSYKIFLIAETA